MNIDSKNGGKVIFFPDRKAPLTPFEVRNVTEYVLAAQDGEGTVNSDIMIDGNVHRLKMKAEREMALRCLLVFLDRCNIEIVGTPPAFTKEMFGFATGRFDCKVGAEGSNVKIYTELAPSTGMVMTLH